MNRNYLFVLVFVILGSVGVFGLDCFGNVCYDTNICMDNINNTALCIDTVTTDVNNDSIVEFTCGIDGIVNCGGGQYCDNNLSYFNASHSLFSGGCVSGYDYGFSSQGSLTEYSMRYKNLNRNTWDGMNYPLGALTTLAYPISSPMSDTSFQALFSINRGSLYLGNYYNGTLLKFNASNISQPVSSVRSGDATSGNSAIGSVVGTDDYVFYQEIHAFDFPIRRVDVSSFTLGSGNITGQIYPYGAIDPFDFIVAQGRVIVPNYGNDNTIKIFDASDMSELGTIVYVDTYWNSQACYPPTYTGDDCVCLAGCNEDFDISSNPVVAGDYLYFTVQNVDLGGDFYCDESYVLKYNLYNLSEHYTSARISDDNCESEQLIVSNNYVYYPKTILRQYNASNLALVRQNNVGAILQIPSIDNNYLYAIGSNGVLYQMNSTNLTVFATYSGVSYQIPPIIKGDYVYVTNSNFLYRLDKNNVSTLIDTLNFTNTIEHLAVSDSYLYVLTYDNLYQVYLGNYTTEIAVFNLSDSLNVTSVSVSPSVVYGDSGVSCSFSVSSSDSSVSNEVSWYVNNVFSSSTVINGLSGNYSYGGSKVKGDVLRCDVFSNNSIGGSDLGSASKTVQNSLHTYGVVGRNVSSPTIFNHLFFSVVASDVDNDVSSVSFNVSTPSGSVLLNGSLVNGSWVSSDLFIGVAGSYSVRALGDDGSASGVSSFIVTDVWSIDPSFFTGVVNAGDTFVIDLDVTSDSTESLSYDFSFSLPSGFSGSVIPNPVSFVGADNVSVSIFTNASLPEDEYYGNLTVRRLIDNDSVVLPLTLGISSSFGQPFIVNKTDWSVSIQNTGSSTRLFYIDNIGGYTLSECTPSLGGDFVGWNFYSFSRTNFTVGVGQMTNFSVSYSSPPPSTYRGYLQVTCKSASGGQLNSLVKSNRPYLQLVSTTSTPPPSVGGGGGGSNVVEVVAGNVTLFVATTDSGSAKADLFMYPSQSREQLFVVTSKVASDLNLFVKCSGNACPYVVLSKAGFKLAGFNQELVMATISLPSTVSYGDVFVYDLMVDNGAGYTSVVRSTITVSRFNKWYSKYSVVVKEGDSGFWFNLGDFAVPKLLLYLILVIVVELLAYGLLPDDKKHADMNTLIFVGLGLGVFLGVPLIF